ELVVLDAGLGAQRLEIGAAVKAEGDELARVVRMTRGRAFAQERKSPAPLRAIRAQAEEQRRVLASEPAQDLGGHLRIRPRLRVRHRELPAVGERSLLA